MSEVMAEEAGAPATNVAGADLLESGRTVVVVGCGAFVCDFDKLREARWKEGLESCALGEGHREGVGIYEK
jgi:hypothetical protein